MAQAQQLALGSCRRRAVAPSTWVAQTAACTVWPLSVTGESLSSRQSSTVEWCSLIARMMACAGLHWTGMRMRGTPAALAALATWAAQPGALLEAGQQPGQPEQPGQRRPAAQPHAVLPTSTTSLVSQERPLQKCYDPGMYPHSSH